MVRIFRQVPKKPGGAAFFERFRYDDEYLSPLARNYRPEFARSRVPAMKHTGASLKTRDMFDNWMVKNDGPNSTANVRWNDVLQNQVLLEDSTSELSDPSIRETSLQATKRPREHFDEQETEELSLKRMKGVSCLHHP